ncbi:hypothetical protein QUF72_07170 [Desulfobacterales bacterium HSG2]|nr:hypothetical protein [Desulfobacterales bacterium HSG2]
MYFHGKIFGIIKAEAQGNKKRVHLTPESVNRQIKDAKFFSLGDENGKGTNFQVAVL